VRESCKVLGGLAAGRYGAGMHRENYRNPVGYRDWRYLKLAESCWK